MITLRHPGMAMILGPEGLRSRSQDWKRDCTHWIPMWFIAYSVTLHFNGHFSRWTWVSRCQNVSILDFTGAKNDGDGGNNWSCKTCKASVKMSPANKPKPSFLQAGCPSCRLTNSVKALKENLCEVYYFCIEIYSHVWRRRNYRENAWKRPCGIVLRMSWKV